MLERVAGLRLVRAGRTTLRALIEEGLRRVLADRQARRRGFRLRRASFKGKGVSDEFAGESWSAVRFPRLKVRNPLV